MSKSTLQRQKLIADLIEEGKITSQNQLKGILKKQGISITQATLSRDLTEIGASKKRDSNNNLKYILPKDDVNNAQKSIAKKALRDFVLSVEPVSNQVIIKTTTAAAQVVAEAIDNLYIDDIAASIAGDNIVLIISYGNKEVSFSFLSQGYRIQPPHIYCYFVPPLIAFFPSIFYPIFSCIYETDFQLGPSQSKLCGF